MEQIICQNLAIGYDGKVLLQDINFSVKDGDYLCIIGENGSGKSTLMRTLLNLQQPIRGKITFGAGVKSDEIGYLPADDNTKRFSCIRERDYSLRMSESCRHATIL